MKIVNDASLFNFDRVLPIFCTSAVFEENGPS